MGLHYAVEAQLVVLTVMTCSFRECRFFTLTQTDLGNYGPSSGFPSVCWGVSGARSAPSPLG